MYKKSIKRLLDIVFSLVLLPILFTIIVICGIIIKLEDGGPIFYCGSRLGKDGLIFKMIKLRSMKVNSPDLRNSDGSTVNSDDDIRLTKIGRILRKTSLDELPQVFNVILGNMSFIGPRPDLPEALERYSEIEILKLKVRPGISGYSQAYYRNSILTKDKFQNDVYYVKNLSFFLDLKLLFITVFNVLNKKNINTSDSEVNYYNKSGAKTQNKINNT